MLASGRLKTMGPIALVALSSALASCRTSGSRGAPAQSGADGALGDAAPATTGTSLALPPDGKLYHGVFPGSLASPGSEDAITSADVDSYETTVGHRAAWVYFSHEWSHGEAFPIATATWIRARGAVPFVRIMMRSTAETGRTTRETKYALSTIVAGQHDAALAAWGDAARAFGTPILAEWGTEMNGAWFPWNGSHNAGGGAAGVALFRDAYRHVVDTIRARGATRVTWVFHVNGDDQPPAEWNRFESYYPGDAWADWVGLSAYGAQTPNDPCPGFVTYVDAAVARFAALAPSKPVFVLELGSTESTRTCSTAPAAWAGTALDALAARRWPSVRGFSWWNEKWENGGTVRPTNMRVQDVPGLADAFQRALARGTTVDRPAFP
jgi:hypothetical protein